MPSSWRMRPWRVLAASAIPVLSMALLLGCNSSRTDTTGSIGPAATDQGAGDDRLAELKKATQYWGGKFQADDKDREAGMNYARNLRALKLSTQAASVLRTLLIHHKDDRAILAEYGKALSEAGSHDQAIDALQQALDPQKPDWRLISAQGVALDQLNRHGEAQAKYHEALKLVPGEPAVLSNLGLSYALSKDLDKAAAALRQAAGHPGADAQVKQNLALVLGLQGKFDESAQIASAALPPAQASANTAYLKQMMSQRDNWSKLQKLEPRPALKP